MSIGHKPAAATIVEYFPQPGSRQGISDKELINLRIRRWKFSYPAESDRKEHFTVQAAATFLREHADCFPDGFVPSNPAQLAILAIKVYDVFVTCPDASNSARRTPTDLEVAGAVIEKMRQFEASLNTDRSKC